MFEFHIFVTSYQKEEKTTSLNQPCAHATSHHARQPLSIRKLFLLCPAYSYHQSKCLPSSLPARKPSSQPSSVIKPRAPTAFLHLYQHESHCRSSSIHLPTTWNKCVGGKLVPGTIRQNQAFSTFVRHSKYIRLLKTGFRLLKTGIYLVRTGFRHGRTTTSM